MSKGDTASDSGRPAQYFGSLKECLYADEYPTGRFIRSGDVDQHVGIVVALDPLVSERRNTPASIEQFDVVSVTGKWTTEDYTFHGPVDRTIRVDDREGFELLRRQKKVEVGEFERYLAHWFDPDVSVEEDPLGMKNVDALLHANGWQYVVQPVKGARRVATQDDEPVRVDHDRWCSNPRLTVDDFEAGAYLASCEGCGATVA